MLQVLDFSIAARNDPEMRDAQRFCALSDRRDPFSEWGLTVRFGGVCAQPQSLSSLCDCVVTHVCGGACYDTCWWWWEQEPAAESAAGSKFEIPSKPKFQAPSFTVPKLGAVSPPEPLPP